MNRYIVVRQPNRYVKLLKHFYELLNTVCNEDTVHVVYKTLTDNLREHEELGPLFGGELNTLLHLAHLNQGTNDKVSLARLQRDIVLIAVSLHEAISFESHFCELLRLIKVIILCEQALVLSPSDASVLSTIESIAKLKKEILKFQYLDEIRGQFRHAVHSGFEFSDDVMTKLLLELGELENGDAKKAS